jgi:hypothetical protein
MADSFFRMKMNPADLTVEKVTLVENAGGTCTFTIRGDVIDPSYGMNIKDFQFSFTGVGSQVDLLRETFRYVVAVVPSLNGLLTEADRVPFLEDIGWFPRNHS